MSELNYVDIALVQLCPHKGKIEKNDALLRGALGQLAADPPQLIVLPEAALTGYFLEGATFECARTAEQMALFLAQAWQAESLQPVELICGFFEVADGTLYNSAIALTIEAGCHRILHVHRKLFLPTYGVFDEARFMTRGRHLRVYDGVGGRTGIGLCEDLWHGLVPTVLALKGARLIIVPSASPGRGIAAPQIESMTRWESLLSVIASEHGFFVLYAGLVGFEGGKAMTGGSCVVNPFGEIIGRAPTLEPAILRARLDLHDQAVARAALPLLGDLLEVAPDLLRDHELQGLIAGVMPDTRPVASARHAT